MVNATATLTEGGAAIELTASVEAGWEVVATSYGRASWPMTIFFSQTGVPVLPWYAALNETLPWVPPASLATSSEGHYFEYAPALDEPWATA